jgi:hypothetical protein
MVALGATVLLSAAGAAVLASFHYRTDNLRSGSTGTAAIALVAAIAFVQFVAYAWGGYTSGRMARGAGVWNGMLVPVVALALGAAAYGIGYALDATTRLNIAFATGRFNLSHTRIVQLGTALAIASAVAMFVGAMIGGGFGSRWHTKLEQRAVAGLDPMTATPTATTPTMATTPRRGTIDLRDPDGAPVDERTNSADADAPVVKA